MSVHTYGLEFEILGLNTRAAARTVSDAGIPCAAQGYNHETASMWKAVPDGSLMGDSQQAEIVSPILTPERLNDARTVSRALLKGGARVNTSTGFHVHMGAAQIGLERPLANLVVNYYTAHAIFSKMVAPSRTQSRWCKVLTLEQAQETADRLNAGTLNFANYDRYHSLNLNSISRHGTVEFRLHQGTLNASKALAWVEFLTAMVNYSMANEILSPEIYGLNAGDSLAKLPSLLATLREYNLHDSTVEYLLRRADELGNRG